MLYFKSKWAQVIITEAMIHSTYITGIYSDYGYFENRNHIRICKETWTKMIFCWSTFKIMFHTQPSILKPRWLPLLLVEISNG